MAVSMSSADASPRSSSKIACARYGTSRRFTTKPGVSLQATASLPSAVPKASEASKAASLVCGVRTTSTSFMSCTGLKKCSPTKRSGRPDGPAISSMRKDDVLDAKMASGCTMEPMSDQNDFLISRSSMMASTTMSQSATAPRSDEVEKRPITSSKRASAASCSILPLLTALPSICCRLFSTAAAPAATASAFASHATTWNPDSAAVCAMPWPMRPMPITPTRLMSNSPPAAADSARTPARRDGERRALESEWAWRAARPSILTAGSGVRGLLCSTGTLRRPGAPS
mmetsp:Transcript_171316/g.416552  ORF Transcript_171316/g.416552 Transcript_171316/m.416552 type:complete len:286 (+) Transcript_171316:266-1123(+)